MGSHQSHRQITAPRVLHTVVLDVRYYGSMWAVSFSLTMLLISHLRFSGLKAVSLNFLFSVQPRIVFGTVEHLLISVCAEWWGMEPSASHRRRVLCLELLFESEVFLYLRARTHALLPCGLVNLQLSLSSYLLASVSKKSWDGIQVNFIAVCRCQVWEEQNTAVTTCQNFPCDNRTRHHHTRPPEHLEWIPLAVWRCACLL